MGLRVFYDTDKARLEQTLKSNAGGLPDGVAYVDVSGLSKQKHFFVGVIITNPFNRWSVDPIKCTVVGLDNNRNRTFSGHRPKIRPHGHAGFIFVCPTPMEPKKLQIIGHEYANYNLGENTSNQSIMYNEKVNKATPNRAEFKLGRQPQSSTPPPSDPRAAGWEPPQEYRENAYPEREQQSNASEDSEESFLTKTSTLGGFAVIGGVLLGVGALAWGASSKSKRIEEQGWSRGS